LRSLKPWMCEGFYQPFHKNMENFNPWPFETLNVHHN
jgi:hypothetical protein